MSTSIDMFMYNDHRESEVAVTSRAAVNSDGLNTTIRIGEDGWTVSTTTLFFRNKSEARRFFIDALVSVDKVDEA